MLPASLSASATQLVETIVYAFDWLHVGILVVSPAGRLLFANEAGAGILECGDGLRLDGAGRLTAGSCIMNGTAADFRSVMARTLGCGGTTISVPRPSAKLPLTLTLRPTRAAFASSGAGEGACVLAVIHDPERHANASLTGLRELYGLTATEARLARFMMQGNSIEDCTSVLGIRRTTVKMHLRNLYGKMGVQRQSELVSLLFKSFGNLNWNANLSTLPGEHVYVKEQDVAC